MLAVTVVNAVRFFPDISLNSAGVCSGWIPVDSAANWRSVSRAAARSPPGEVVSLQGGVKGKEHVTVRWNTTAFVHRDCQNKHKMKSSIACYGALRNFLQWVCVYICLGGSLRQLKYTFTSLPPIQPDPLKRSENVSPFEEANTLLNRETTRTNTVCLDLLYM